MSAAVQALSAHAEELRVGLAHLQRDFLELAQRRAAAEEVLSEMDVRDALLFNDRAHKSSATFLPEPRALAETATPHEAPHVAPHETPQAASGRRAHQMCSVEMWPCRIDFSRRVRRDLL